MRKLILQRKKSFIACLAKIRIFVSDSQGDYELGGTKCKQLGVLKNGKTGEYEISNEKVKIFVVFSKVAPQKFHSYYDIPEGNETVELLTFSELNPSAGNPFTIVSK